MNRSNSLLSTSKQARKSLTTPKRRRSTSLLTSLSKGIETLIESSHLAQSLAEAETNYYFFNDDNCLFNTKQEEEEQSYPFESKGSGETTDTINEHDSFNPKDKVNAHLFQWNYEDIENKDTEQTVIADKKKEKKERLNEVVSKAKEQSQCKELQKEVISNPQLAKEYFEQLIGDYDALIELVLHHFGNYFIQAIINVVDDKERIAFIEAISNDFIAVSQNFYGTRVIQHLLYSIKSNELLTRLIDLISLHIVPIITNVISGHILFTVLSYNNKKHNDIIYKSIQLNVLRVAYDKHGSCAIQKIIQNDPLGTNCLVIELIMNSVKLLMTEYGHYSIHFIFSMKNPYYTFNLIRMIAPCFIELANNKFSSTVLEKCFELCQDSNKYFLYQLLLNDKAIQSLLMNEYGNYVLQKAIDYAEPSIQLCLFKLLPLALLTLKRDSFGKQLFSIMCTKYPSVKAMVNYIKEQKKKQK